MRSSRKAARKSARCARSSAASRRCSRRSTEGRMRAKRLRGRLLSVNAPLRIGWPNPRRPAGALLALALLFAAAGVSAQDETHLPAQADPAADLQGYVPGASQLEGQIRAPCCWNQTIDIHGSEIAQALRREIRTRLRGGETVDAIRADIVARYGDRVLAVPPGNPLKDLAVLMVIGVGLAG